jgi:hypothetical protein
MRYAPCPQKTLRSMLNAQHSTLIFICLLFLLPLSLFALTPTPYNADFYGSVEGAKAGDVVTVYDAAGIICGQFTIVTDGQYGFLHVYGDDKTTPAKDGANLNEPLTFKLNGTLVTPSSGETVLWPGDVQRRQVDFKK